MSLQQDPLNPDYAQTPKAGKSRKKWATIAAVAAVAALAGGAGTFASFTASTTNAGSTFETGSIVLSNTVNAGTACFSTGLAAPGTGTFTNNNTNASCTAALNATIKKPGDVATAAIDITGAGNINASSLKLAFDGDPGAPTDCLTADASGTSFHGNGDLCTGAATGLQVKLQETQSNHSTAVSCWFDSDGANAGACGATGGDLNTLDNNNTGSPLTLTGGLTSGSTRYFVLTFTLPDTGAGLQNPVQGRKVDFSLTWTAEQ